MTDQDDHKKQNCHWNTELEIAFLKYLGSYNEQYLQSPSARVRLLNGYRTSMPLRSNWGKIDKNHVAMIVDRMIGELE